VVLVICLLAACGGGSSGSGPDGAGGDGPSDGPPAIDGPVDAPPPPVCGDGSLVLPEGCDDGDTDSGDGCSASCTVEPDFACPFPGQDCVRIVICGNGRIEGGETCDDGNLVALDGCSAMCVREPGWSCPVAGTACVAAECGDGIVAGFEACDDGAHGAGCVACQLEPGFHCPVAGAPCLTTTCGDGLAQGLEECDDGNAIVGDGCTPGCVREPTCAQGVCAPVCGDAVLQTGEGCDDGNRFRGDGCSDSCQEEVGFVCDEVPLPDPSSLTIFATVRDFIASCGTGSRLVAGAAGATAPYGHPDFECYLGAVTGMVAADLDVENKPVRVANNVTSSNASFAQWYRSDGDVNRTMAQAVTLPAIGGGAYRFDSDSFYPATGRGFDTTSCGAGMCEPLRNDGNGAGARNFHFTSELHFWFEYNGTEVLAFSGDDDVWVFINGKLAVDIGGVHGRLDGSVNLGNAAVRMNLGLQLGGVYQAIVFQAERHTSRSQYRLTLTNFNQTPSTCTDLCGDGVVSSREVCDDGAGNGNGDGSDYGGCAADCALEPYCGDAIVDTAHGEICDDGLNLGGNASSCAPGCQSLGSTCGDGVVQTQSGEQCDDGNTVSGDGCSATCELEIG
jgi:fibro-slime domain-containing protein